MTYSSPSIDTVNAYKNPAKSMDVVRTGLSPRSDVSENGRVIDARDPSQIGRNAKLKTQAIDNFVSFLTEDIVPKAVDELKAQGDAAAMEAVTNIPGMADGSFYRQSSAAQQSLIKDYNLNGYALDQLKAYGAGAAVGQYNQQISDALIASPILASTAPQAERDAEKQRIFSENRVLLQNIEPGYLAPFADKLALSEGAAVGKTESMARKARNNELENTAVSAAKESWTAAGSGLVGFDDLDDVSRATRFDSEVNVPLRQSLLKSLPTTGDGKEWYQRQEKGFLDSIYEAIANDEAEQAQFILTAWKVATDTPLRLKNGFNVWDYANNAGADGVPVSKKIAVLQVQVDKLYDKKEGEIAIEASSDDLAAVVNGDQAALNRVEVTIMNMLKDKNIKGAEAVEGLLTRLDSNRESRFKDDIGALGELRTLSRVPDLSDEEFAEAAQGMVNAGLISNSTAIQEMRRRLTPSQLEQNEDQALNYKERKIAGEVDYTKDGAVFVPGENSNVNTVRKSAEDDELVGTQVKEYLLNGFLGDLEVAVRQQFTEAVTNATGEDLDQIIEAESIRLIKKKTASLKADAAKDLKGKLDRAKSVRQPILDAIEEGVPAEKIWGEDILNQAKETPGKRPAEIWKARYAQSLIGLPIDINDPKSKKYDLETAQQEAREELNRIRKKLTEEQYEFRPGGKGVPAPKRVPTDVEVSYDAALPGFEEVVTVAAKNPDQDGDQGLLAVGGTAILNALGRVLPGGGSPAAAETVSNESANAQTLQAVKNSNGWKSLNRMFARRERVSSTSPPLPQLSPTALTDTVAVAMTSDRHPFAVHIGIAEGTRTINGGYTRAYRGHTDPGDGHRNRGTFSGGRGMGNASPQQVDRYWMRELTARSVRIAPVMARAGLRPGTVGYNRFMFNYLDLSVQAPRAADTFAAKISSVKAGNWSIEMMAKARADSFFSPVTGRLQASGFGNNYSRLLSDQRSRAGVWDYKRRI